MKKFFSVLLSILFAIALLLTILLGTLRGYLSLSSLLDLAGKIGTPVALVQPETGLYHPDLMNVARTVQYTFDAGGFDLSSVDFTNFNVNTLVEEICKASGFEVDAETVKEIIQEPDIAAFVDTNVAGILEYAAGTSQELKLDAEDLQKVVNHAIDVYEEKTGEVIDRTGLDEGIAEGVAQTIPMIEETIAETKEENAGVFEIIKLVTKLASPEVLLLAIGVCLILALCIFLIQRNIWITLRYIAVPAFVAGFILFAVALIAKPLVSAMLPPEIVALAMGIVLTVFGKIGTSGIITAAAGIVMGIPAFILGRKKKEI